MIYLLFIQTILLLRIVYYPKEIKILMYVLTTAVFAIEMIGGWALKFMEMPSVECFRCKVEPV